MKDAGKLLSIKLKGGNPMRKRNIWKKISGAAAVGVMAVSIILPVQAATEAARANNYTYYDAYLEPLGNQKRAVTGGGSAYDDKGYALRAYLVAGVNISGSSSHDLTYVRFEGTALEPAITGFHYDVISGIHDCIPRWLKYKYNKNIYIIAI